MLPDELWALILSNISYTQINKLILVCKQFKRVIDSKYFEQLHLDYYTFKLAIPKLKDKYKQFKRNCAKEMALASSITNNVLMYKKCIMVRNISDYDHYEIKKNICEATKHNNIDILSFILDNSCIKTRFNAEYIYWIIDVSIRYKRLNIFDKYISKMSCRCKREILTTAVVSDNIDIVINLLKRYDYDNDDIWIIIKNTRKDLDIAFLLLNYIKNKS